ncbi:MAG: hypothetical protein LBV79_02855 [Candidatus Adiutrix sp.]|jgi:hypothetical protein|nr:hypothetical protein [Candidatus Adiutrix sp.]
MTFSQWLLGRRKAPVILIVLMLMALPGFPGLALGQEYRGAEAALTQADIDGYVYLAPRLVGPAAQDVNVAARLLAESGLTRRRAMYVGARIAVAQALVTGALTPDMLNTQNASGALQPTAEELALVQQNLTSLTQAQIECIEARRKFQNALTGEPNP